MEQTIVNLIRDYYPLGPSGEKDFRTLELKNEHLNRPIWIAPDGCIYFENFHKKRKVTQSLLKTVAEPVSRPEHIHTYKLTDSSLYAAVSGGLKAEDILRYLEQLSKTKLPENIISFIKTTISNHGRTNLILRHGKFKIVSKNLEQLRFLISDLNIKECLIKDSAGQPIIHQEIDDLVDYSNPSTSESDLAPDLIEFYKKIDRVFEENSNSNFFELLRKGKIAFSFEILESQLENVKKRCIDLKSTLLSEYDFRNDNTNRDIQMDLKPTTSLRPYQEESVQKMFAHHRARSGIIVFPCGAGKTLVGLAAACKIRKQCIVFCICELTVEQWRNHFLHYTTIEEEKICRFTDSTNDPAIKTDVLVTTYNMIPFSGKRSYGTRKALEWIYEREWGLIILDEVQVIPAEKIRSILQVIHGYCMLGLTETLVREDKKIIDLNFLIGPKLYEADLMELRDEGFIARVQCFEVRCKMTEEFYYEYLRAPENRQMLLYIMNPEKIRCCEYLVRYHERRGDKIIVFSDNLFALRYYADTMKCLYLDRHTSHEEFIRVIETLKVNTIFVSKIADVAIDLPEATVLIQISSHGVSGRQEAQRLGRITRAKKVDAFFYTLISSDTTEQLLSAKHQQILKDQGYALKVVTKLDGMDKEELVFDNKAMQADLLAEVLTVHENACEVECGSV